MDYYELIWLFEQKKLPGFIASNFIVPFLYSKPIKCETCNKVITSRNKSVAWFFDGKVKCPQCIPIFRIPMRLRRN